MLRCRDGPAAGQMFLAGRAPRFLRVTHAGADPRRGWDCLDQLGDRPRPNERLYAYRRVTRPSSVHVQASGPGGRGRRCFWTLMADYRVVEPQPADVVLRDTVAWQEWALAQDARARAVATPTGEVIMTAKKGRKREP